jgi:hypothetical protein
MRNWPGANGEMVEFALKATECQSGPMISNGIAHAREKK